MICEPAEAGVAIKDTKMKADAINQNELYALDEDSVYSNLDDCINASCEPDLNSLASLIHGPPRAKKPKSLHLKPMAFVRLNTRHGKPKPVTVKALLDSGAAGSLVTKEFVNKLRKKRSASQSWNTPGGTLTTNETVKAQFTTPELQDNKLIEWNLHVTDSLGSNDMIIGRDLLQFLRIDILFSDQTAQWGTSRMPFKDVDATVQEAYHIQDDGPLTEASDRIKHILDAKYSPIDIDDALSEQDSLSDAKRGTTWTTAS